MAVNSLLRSFSLDAYSGSNSTLKQVCEVGRRSVSGPPRCMVNLSAAKPSTGALHVTTQDTIPANLQVRVFRVDQQESVNTAES